jgi:hypothetical protein
VRRGRATAGDRTTRNASGGKFIDLAPGRLTQSLQKQLQKQN